MVSLDYGYIITNLTSKVKKKIRKNCTKTTRLNCAY
nr:MAG TPA: hypothetical protein [Caudoviricetes sp.]